MKNSTPHLRRVNVKHLAEREDGTIFEGQTLGRFYDADPVMHSEFRNARMLHRWDVPAVRLILGRWYAVEHRCRPPRGKPVWKGTPCRHPDAAPGSDLVGEVERIVGQLPGSVRVESPDVLAGLLADAYAVVEIQTVKDRMVWNTEKGRWDREPTPRDQWYSKIERVLGRPTLADLAKFASEQASVNQPPVGTIVSSRESAVKPAKPKAGIARSL